MSNYVLEVNNIAKSFEVGSQQVPVLKDVSLQVKQSDFTVIFGPSGCGKSTLLHTILGLEEPTSGRVRFLAKDLYGSGMTEGERADWRKQHVGMVYQQPNWIRSLSVVENVAFPLQLLGQPKRIAMEHARLKLELVGIGEWAGYRPMELSSGQQQRVALARALVSNPEVIIADEPTGNLDYEAGQQIMQLLAELNRLVKKTIIMVTHDLEYLPYANAAIRMLDGQVVEQIDSKDMGKLEKNIKGKRGSGMEKSSAMVTPTATPVKGGGSHA